MGDKMNDLKITITVISIAFAIFLILYIFSNFSYKFSAKSVVMKWRILKFVPIGSREIDLEDIREARRFEFRKDILGGGFIFGNLFTKRGVLLVLRKRFLSFLYTKRIFVTPENPEEFINKIKERQQKTGSVPK
jgi:hypothetical protein